VNPPELSCEVGVEMGQVVMVEYSCVAGGELSQVLMAEWRWVEFASRLYLFWLS